MNLTTAELRQLPLPAAFVDVHGTLIANTPEWVGATPGAVSYPVRRNRLVVSTSNTDPHYADLLDQLLDAIGQVGQRLDQTKRTQVGMLVGSLRLLSGRFVASSGSASDVLEQARVGIAARTSLRVELAAGTGLEPWVAGPEVAALILVQIAANAERHGGAAGVVLATRGTAFEVRWRQPRPVFEVPALRQRAGRQRWGMGFARIAADTLGGALYPLHLDREGGLVATLELGVNRLALPLAVLREGRIHKATRAWDEETSCPPGTRSEADSRISEAAAGARRADGRLTVVGGWWARSVGAGSVVWLAVPPDDILDRARDVLDGIVHERVLWDGIPEPDRSRIFALATLLERTLGEPMPRVPSATWMRRYAELVGVHRVELAAPELRGPGAIDPRVVLHVVLAGGTRFEVDGDDLYLHVRPGSIGDAVSRAFEHRADGALRMS